MQTHDLSRREFVLGATTAMLSVATARGQSRDLTAQDVADRIRANVGVPWREKTVDGFKAGDPATVVTGVATSVMATMDVLRRAAAAHQNFIIVQEPTFYSADDSPGARAADPVYLAKKNFIAEERLVVWRFSDHWNARQPSEAVIALAAMLRLPGPRAEDASGIYQLPEMTLGALTSHVRASLPVRGGLRTVGEPGLGVRTVFISPGTTDLAVTVQNLPRADVILAGEPREWEAVPYALDTWAAGRGQGKGLIALGRVVSEGPSAMACSEWIKRLVPGIPVAVIPTADPYWSPAV
jgi:putative NIF3 family GTP cyclohydrolase 1 type 2